MFRDASGETAGAGIDVGFDTILFGLAGLEVGVVIYLLFAGSPAGASAGVIVAVITEARPLYGPR